MIEASVSVHDDIEDIYECIFPEIEKQKRSSLRIERDAQKLEFKIEAQDITALKATLNSVTQMLTVFNKVRKIKNENEQ